MICANPYNNGQGMLFGCGQCMPCRFNRRRIWTHRIMLECGLHGSNSFVTLTYSDEKLPLTKDKLPTLDPKHIQDFLKRFRKAIEPLRIRYYVVGEYGDLTQRPHYHAALFGYPPCSYGNTRLSKRNTPCCSICETVNTAWGHGQILLGDLNTSSAQYIAGYVTKKLNKNHPDLKGRYPEYSRMSLRPGIGADFMHEVASTLMEFNLEKGMVDVPSTLRHGSRELPLGNYLQKKLRKLIGRDEKAPQETLDKIREQLQPLRQNAFDNSRSFTQEVIDAGEQQRLNQATRAKVRKQRKKL